MDTFSIKYVLVTLAILICISNGKSTTPKDPKVENTTHNCPFTRIIEDIFNINNRNSDRGMTWKEKKTDYLINTTNSFFAANQNISKSIQDELVNDIIASINRIKANLSNTADNKLNEAIILNIQKNSTNSGSKVIGDKKVNQIKSGMEDKIDVIQPSILKHDEKFKKDTTKTDIEKPIKSSNYPDRANYVEILTIEPNNTNISNTSSHSILEVLRNIMPALNTSKNKDLHSITIIESNENKNHSFTETKNVSTIIVKYCDKENQTKNNTSINELKHPDEAFSVSNNEDDYYLDVDNDYGGINQDKTINSTIEIAKDVLQAAEYGMRKMHELYTVLEPKLYSMGLMLNEKDPARYVAAFNAPSEDTARFAKYGYASLQASAKFRELISENDDGLEKRTEERQFPGLTTLRQSSLLKQCPLKGPPECPPASKRYRTHDGTCNNLSHPRWGATMTPVQRFIQPHYSDDIQAPRRSIFGSELPSAREISTLVHEDKNAENPGITHLLMQWGQFLDHDITSSSQSRGFNGSVPRCCKDGGRDFIPREFMHPECMPIAVSPSDPFYGPRGVRCLDFIRSSPAPRDNCALGWREQFNQVSAYIDASPIYATSAKQSDKMRVFRNGMLNYGRTSQRRPLKTDRADLCRSGAVSTECFKSGDARVNEHPGLVAAHIVWLKQHNRLAQELSHLNPHWSDEKIYQETRKIVGAMMQHITYREFLPIVLGSEVMRLFELELQPKGFFRGYSPDVNASPASAFGTAAFRFGHSLVQPSLVRYDRLHRPLANNVSLHDELTNLANIWSLGSVDRLLLGMVNQPIQKRDEFITEELTNHLFQTPFFNFGMDLAAINIQRGRDHGVPPYTAWREPCGLSAITSFEDLFRVMPARVVKKLKVIYRHVHDVDLFTGGMAERPVVGGLVGPTFACIIAQQFSNIRKGDRFWYENGGLESSFTPAQLQQIRRISLAQVLCSNLDNIDNIQPFVFLSPNNPDNDRISCRNKLLNNFDLFPWVELNSDSKNDIRKSDEDAPSTSKPLRTKSTTIKSKTTTRISHEMNPPSEQNKINDTLSVNKPQKPNQRLNTTNYTDDNKVNKTINQPKPDPTVQVIDDKLDFKFKTRRYSDQEQDTGYEPNRQYNDYYDDVQSVQSVVINNLPHKRPNSRPYISVTENIDKYTYLINYVPRPTQSWRQTTRRNHDRDIVKVTYQTYDDTYRRPYRPYYNRDELEDDFESRDNKPNTPVTETSKSSARSNDDSLFQSNHKLSTETFIVTNRPKPITEQTSEKIDPTTENIYKLLTFGYVGTYRGDTTNNHEKSNINKVVKEDVISKDFSTIEPDKSVINNELNNGKLSTFILYDTATKPYNSQRPTRRNDEETSDLKNKYYYIHNILRKYADSTDQKNKNVVETKDQLPEIPKEPYINVTNWDIQERSGIDKIMNTGDSKAGRRDKPSQKIKKPTSSAMTASVAFQVIPSENNPSQWAVYDEKEDLPDSPPPRMPSIKSDPYALREIPRPIDFNFIRRRPGRL